MMALVDNSSTNTFIFNIGTRPPSITQEFYVKNRVKAASIGEQLVYKKPTDGAHTSLQIRLCWLVSLRL